MKDTRGGLNTGVEEPAGVGEEIYRVAIKKGNDDVLAGEFTAKRAGRLLT